MLLALRPVAVSFALLSCLSNAVASSDASTLIRGEARVSQFIASVEAPPQFGEAPRLPVLPTLTAIQFDAAGAPVAQVSVYAGSGFAMREAALTEYLRGFSLTRQAVEQPKQAQDEFVDVLLLERPAAVTTPAEFSVVDRAADLVVEFRHIESNGPLGISCSASSVLTWNSNLAGGWYWILFDGATSTVSDMIAVAAGPNRASSADPDLYLERLSGTTWGAYSSSTSSTQVDMVRGVHGGCTSTRWRVRLHMYQGGWSSGRAVRFHAS